MKGHGTVSQVTLCWNPSKDLEPESEVIYRSYLVQLSETGTRHV